MSVNRPTSGADGIVTSSCRAHTNFVVVPVERRSDRRRIPLIMVVRTISPRGAPSILFFLTSSLSTLHTPHIPHSATLHSLLSRAASVPSSLPHLSLLSFHLHAAVRSARAAWRSGHCSTAEYRRTMAAHLGMAVGVQEALGLDVLVHGEAERSEMVEFFGQELEVR